MSIDFSLDEQGIALITINRPEKRNAMDAEHYQGLSDAWTRVRDDTAVRVAIITGAGDKAFSAGADLKSWIGREVDPGELWLTQKGQLLNRGLEVWKPVIAAVNGACIGGGTTLLLATDIRISVPDATFGLSEVKRGVIAGNGGTQRIIRQLPYCIAMKMLMTGDAISAQNAERWGLINEIVERDNCCRSRTTTRDALQRTDHLLYRLPKNSRYEVRRWNSRRACDSSSLPVGSCSRQKTSRKVGPHSPKSVPRNSKADNALATQGHYRTGSDPDL